MGRFWEWLCDRWPLVWRSNYRAVWSELTTMCILKRQAEANQRRALDKINELETELAAERMSIPHEVQRAEDKAIAAQSQIGALKAELAKAREERDQARIKLEQVISGRLMFLEQLKNDFVVIGGQLKSQFDWLWKEKELFNASSVKEDGRKDHHQRVNHDHPDQNQGRSDQTGDRGAEDRGGPSGGCGQG